MSCVVTGSRGSYAGGMVGAALSRRAGLGSAAAALVLALMAGTGGGGPAGHKLQDAADMAAILPGRRGIAFKVQLRGPLLIARRRGPEHPVAAAGWPEMWTRSGNLIVVLHRPGSARFGYAVYSPSGTRL